MVYFDISDAEFLSKNRTQLWWCWRILAGADVRTSPSIVFLTVSALHCIKEHTEIDHIAIFLILFVMCSFALSGTVTVSAFDAMICCTLIEIACMSTNSVIITCSQKCCCSSSVLNLIFSILVSFVF